MKFGLKRIFKKKSKGEKAAATPKKSKASATPPTPSTEPVKEDPPSATDERRDDGSHDQDHSSDADLPIKNLLEELSVHASDLAGDGDGDMELVLGDTGTDVPDDEPPMESPFDEDNKVEQTKSEDEQEEVHVVAEQNVDTHTPKTANVETKEEEIPIEAAETVNNDTFSVDSPLRPRQLDPSGTIAGDDDESIAEPAPVKPLVEKEEQVTLTGTLMSMLKKAKECTSGVVLPEPIQKLFPTADNVLCQTIGMGGRVRSDLSAKNRPKLVRQYSYCNEQFALKILDELVNVGYALVNHQQNSTADSIAEDEDDDEGDWVGRSVTLILRPGTCNSLLVQAPYLEWSTLGGGQQTGIETTSVSLLDIHSVVTSNAEDMQLTDEGEDPTDEADDDEDEKEDLQCFFSLTTKQGQIYVMEAITADESQRLVAGVKNLVSRLSKQLVAGDKAVLSDFFDFFDNSNDLDDTRVSEEEAMNRVSHLLLDHME